MKTEVLNHNSRASLYGHMGLNFTIAYSFAFDE